MGSCGSAFCSRTTCSASAAASVALRAAAASSSCVGGGTAPGSHMPPDSERAHTLTPSVSFVQYACTSSGMGGHARGGQGIARRGAEAGARVIDMQAHLLGRAITPTHHFQRVALKACPFARLLSIRALIHIEASRAGDYVYKQKHQRSAAQGIAHADSSGRLSHSRRSSTRILLVG